MRSAASWILAIALVLPGLAAADELTPQKRADIRQLIGATGGTRLSGQLAEVTSKNISSALKRQHPDLPEDVAGKLKAELMTLFEERANVPGGLVDLLGILPRQAELAGATVVDRSSVLTTHLAEIVRGYSARLLGREDVKLLTDVVRRTHPAVIDELTPALLSLGEIQRVLQALLDESVSIRDLPRIFEALSLRARAGKDIDGLVEAVRETLGPALVAPYVDEGTINVLTFEPLLEQRLLEALRVGDAGGFIVLEPDHAQLVLNQVTTLAQQAEEQNLTPVLVCAPQVRSAVRRLVAPSMPRLPVLAYNELGGPVQIRSVGVVTGVVPATPVPPVPSMN